MAELDILWLLFAIPKFLVRPQPDTSCCAGLSGASETRPGVTRNTHAPSPQSLFVILGIILLLPGVCGVIVIGIGIWEGDPGAILLFALPSVAIGVAGIFLLLRQVLRKRQ